MLIQVIEDCKCALTAEFGGGVNVLTDDGGVEGALVHVLAERWLGGSGLRHRCHGARLLGLQTWNVNVFRECSFLVSVSYPDIFYHDRVVTNILESI